MEKLRKITFQPYGPFEIPTLDRGPDRKRLNEFWKAIEEAEPGLPKAIGCYVFAIRAERGIRRWYVGKTDRIGFKGEAFQPQKLVIYGEVLRARKRGTPLLYLIARHTPGQRLKKRADENKVIGRLEELLIGSALLRNPDLANKRTTVHFREMQIPGYMNEPPGARTKEAKGLSKLLGVSRR